MRRAWRLLMLEAVFSFEGITAGASTSAALLLYKIQRDIADIRKDHQHTRDWVERIKRHLWPATFGR